MKSSGRSEPVKLLEVGEKIAVVPLSNIGRFYCRKRGLHGASNLIL